MFKKCCTKGIRWSKNNRGDLDFADDIFLFNTSVLETQAEKDGLGRTTMVGLIVNQSKTDVMMINSSDNSKINIEGDALKGGLVLPPSAARRAKMEIV